MDQSTETKETTVSFPTTPDAEGFYYENQADQEQGITTKVYENDSKVKRAMLPGCKKLALVRELRATDTKEIRRFMDSDKEKYELAAITVATTLDGEKQPFEVIGALKMKDYTRVSSMYSDLNF